MKKVLKSLALTGSMLAIAATAQAANTVQVTLTSPAILKSGCEKIGSYTVTFDQGTVLTEGDWFYMDLPTNTSICTTIDYMIANGRTAGSTTNSITYPSTLLTPAQNNVDLTPAGTFSALVTGINGLAAGTSGPAAAGTANGDNLLAGPFVNNIVVGAGQGVVVNGGIVLRVYAPKDGRRVWVYVYGTTAGTDTLTVPNDPTNNSKLTLHLVDGQRYTGSVITNTNVTGASANVWGDSNTDDIALTAGAEYTTPHHIPNPENSLCVNAANMAGDLMFVSFNSFNSLLTFTGDSQIAHTGTTNAITLEACQAGTGKGALAKPLKGNIPIPTTQSGGCIYDYETPVNAPLGYCATNATNPFSGNRMLLKSINNTTFGDPGDRFDMTLKVASSAASTKGVYWASAGVGVYGYTAAQYTSATDCTAGAGTNISPVFVSNASGFDTGTCTVAAGNQADTLTTNTTGAISGLTNFNSLWVDMPNMVYDKAVVGNGIESNVTITLTKYPCGGTVFTGNRVIGTFVSTCPTTSVAGSTTMLYPFLPALDGSMTGWWGGFTVVNGSNAGGATGNAGTCTLTFTNEANTVATMTTPTIQPGGQWNPGSMSQILAGLSPAGSTIGTKNVAIVAVCGFSQAGGFAFTGNGNEGTGYTAYILSGASGSGSWQ